MTNKFEQLIEHVINDDAEKAKALFHEIVVEKSREIYENLMNEEEEELDEESDAERDDKAEKAGKKVAKDIEYDELHEEEEDLEEDMSAEASDDLIDDVEAEEEGMYEEDDAEAEFDDSAEEAGDELTKDIEADHDAGEGDIEDRVVDLEDKLDELMAEFEALMGGEEEVDGMDAEFDDVGGHDVEGDSLEMDDTAEFTQAPLGENISLPSAPKPVTTEPAGTNTKSTTAFNSGAAGMASKPVKATGATESNPDGTAAYKAPHNAYSKGEGNLPGAGTFKNTPAKDGSKLAAAPKPVTSQAAGVNTKTPFPKA